MGQAVKSSKKRFLKDFYPDLNINNTTKTIIENKENKELLLEDEYTLQTFTILNIENSILTVKEFDKAKQGTYMTISVIEIDMSDDSVTNLGLCYAR